MSDIIIVTETWLQPDILSSELGLLNYNVFRRDRDLRLFNTLRAGGVIICVKNNIEVELILSDPTIEQLILKISHSSSKYILSASYVQPASSADVYIRHIYNIESTLEKFPDYQPILLGDYNLPRIFWSMDPLQYSQLAYIDPNLRAAAGIACASFCTFNLIQYYQPHPDKGYSLDLLFASEGIISPLDLQEQLLPTDNHHVACFFEISTSSTFLNSNNRVRRNFYKANHAEVSRNLSEMNWELLLRDMATDPDLTLETFYSILNSLLDVYVPLTKQIPNSYPKW